MLKKVLSVSAIAVLVILGAHPLEAQEASSGSGSFHSGLKLKGSYVYNRSSLDTEQKKLTEPSAGWNAGLEIVGESFGFGLTGFTAGEFADFQADSTSFIVLAEVNYYAPVKVLRLAPYAGVHTGLGTYTTAYFSDPTMPKLQDRSPGSIGFQFGARWQPVSLGSVDVQWRRLSTSAAEAQGSGFERTQVLLGVTLF